MRTRINLIGQIVNSRIVIEGVMRRQNESI